MLANLNQKKKLGEQEAYAARICVPKPLPSIFAWTKAAQTTVSLLFFFRANEDAEICSDIRLDHVRSGRHGEEIESGDDFRKG
ncbi:MULTISPECIES: hypothetical protein [Rhizobium]|uniref:hypothetical protein n=1 Tax=Rhizobium TaxID=379 RepID=UPI001C83D166|nr:MULTISPECIES: hypothetical protein [Rhizobium]MBX4899263.1 hypothetical protein [Rhizobium bangladeshense]MBX5297440.1 hypothetical protein [Rhizobium sp. NLR15a]MBY3617480.1 hypothetical protein [Rhizobium bangladeshense]